MSGPVPVFPPQRPKPALANVASEAWLGLFTAWAFFALSLSPIVAVGQTTGEVPTRESPTPHEPIAPAIAAPAAPLPAPAAVAPIGLPGTLPSTSYTTPPPALPRVFAPSRPRNTYTRYQWKLNIVSTVFWIGEQPTQNNPTPNDKSSWDTSWSASYGGYDDPDPSQRTERYHPKAFLPNQNPFYIALPYNDVQSGTYRTKVEARQIIPWFHRKFERSGHTVLKGRWVAIRRGGKVCYGQWEDVGPFETDDWRYVFGDSRPRTTGNGGAGLDVSPAIRDFLDFESGHAVCDWRFVDVQEVPEGPWKWFGANNDFVQQRTAAETRPTGEGAGE